jgi:hypothetical protein
MFFIWSQVGIPGFIHTDKHEFAKVSEKHECEAPKTAGL